MSTRSFSSLEMLDVHGFGDEIDCLLTLGDASGRLPSRAPGRNAALVPEPLLQGTCGARSPPRHPIACRLSWVSVDMSC